MPKKDIEIKSFSAEEWQKNKNSRIREFLGKRDASKFGDLYISNSKSSEEDNNYHVRYFSDSEAKKAWLADKANNANLVLADFILPKDIADGTSYSVDLDTTDSRIQLVSTTGEILLHLAFTSRVYDPLAQAFSDSGETGTLHIERKEGNEDWKEILTTSIASCPFGNKVYKEIDISSYITGNQQIRAYVIGDDSERKTRVLNYQSVIKTTLSLAYAGDWRKPITDGVIPLSYKVTGAVAKTLHVKVSGLQSDGKTVGYREYTEQLGSTVSETATNGKISDSDTDAIKINNNGIHTLEAWLTVDASGEETEHIYSQVLVIKDATATIPYVIVNNRAQSAMMYTETHFFDFAVYNPAANTTAVKMVAKNTDGSTTYKEKDYGNLGNGSASSQNVQSYTDTFEIDADDTTAVWFHFTLNGAETTTPVHIDVKANKAFKPTSSPDFVLAPNNRTNKQ
jgi:hypothetical protein